MLKSLHFDDKAGWAYINLWSGKLNKELASNHSDLGEIYVYINPDHDWLINNPDH